jgi:hypothetical protein
MREWACCCWCVGADRHVSLSLSLSVSLCLTAKGTPVLGSALVEACNRFYTRIPHDFGFNKPPIINTIKVIQGTPPLSPQGHTDTHRHTHTYTSRRETQGV